MNALPQFITEIDGLDNLPEKDRLERERVFEAVYLRGDFLSSLRQSERNQLRRKVPRTDGNHDELLSAGHEGHRKPGLISGQFHFKQSLARLLVEGSELPATALWAGREQPRAVTRKQERFGNQQRRAFGIAETTDIDSRKCRMILHVVR